MLNKIIIYVDMDDVLTDYAGAYWAAKDISPEIEYPQGEIGFFENLKPLDHAIESVNHLRACELYETYILTAPSTFNAHSYTEKRLWVENYFDYAFTKRLIISPNKSLLRGDILIDDNASGKGQEKFAGELIQFGSDLFPSWQHVMSYVDQLKR